MKTFSIKIIKNKKMTLHDKTEEGIFGYTKFTCSR